MGGGLQAGAGGEAGLGRSGAQCGTSLLDARMQ